jgi:CheY-like chemotaxis protein
MPRLTGTEAIERIQRLRLPLPCILMSGQLDEELRRRVKAFEVLSKPVSFAQVTQTVVAALKSTYDWSQAWLDEMAPRQPGQLPPSRHA